MPGEPPPIPPRPIASVALCGAGAVGSAYAEKLHDLDPCSFCVIAGGERRALLEREGLTVNGRTFPVRCRAPGEAGPPADLLLVAVKGHHLAATAAADASAAIGDGTVILPLLNGITSEAVLGRAFGAEKVLHGFVVGNDVVREGTRTRYSRIGRLFLGAASNDLAREPRRERHDEQGRREPAVHDRPAPAQLGRDRLAEDGDEVVGDAPAHELGDAEGQDRPTVDHGA